MTRTVPFPRCSRHISLYRGLLLVSFSVTFMLLYRMSNVPSIHLDTVTTDVTSAKGAEPESEKALVERMKKYCIKREELGETLIIATANTGNAEMLENWMASMSKYGHDHYFIISLDPHLLAALRATGVEHAGLVPSTWLSENRTTLSEGEQQWGADEYFTLTKSKNVIMRKLLGHGFTVIFTDVDLVWRSPHVLDYINYYMWMHRWQEAVFALDSPLRSSPSKNKPNVNTGFYYVRPTERVMALFDEAIRIQNKLYKTHDQKAMEMAYWDTKGVEAWVGFFESALIMNGDHYFKRNLAKTKLGGIEPFVVHANYFVGFEVKKAKLKDAGLWYI